MHPGRVLRTLVAAVLVVACGPSAGGPADGGGIGGDGGGRVDGGYMGPTGAISGTVFAPGNAPSMVPAGHEIPIAGALVYVSLWRPDPIPQEAYCEPCENPPGGSALTDAHGSFTLSGIAPGTYWLVIQKGQFRLEQQVLVAGGETIALPPQNTTLPSQHDPANGLWVPRMALAEGFWDNIEDILGKMSIGQVDADGRFVGSSAAGNFDVYWNGTADLRAFAISDLNYLVSDLARMKQYHIIFVPCSNGLNDQLFGNPAVRQNIRDYVAAGGKFYVTDWSGEWEDVVFPEFIVYTDGYDTPAGAMPGQFNESDDRNGYTSETARAQDPELAAWLDGQAGPLVVAEGYYENGVVDADSFVVEGNWNHIQDTPSVMIGMDDEGLPISEQARAWVMGDWGGGEGPIHPLTVTFEPVGCGRVLYSTYHTADWHHAGLLPQERVLLYLIMELGLCKSGPIVL